MLNSLPIRNSGKKLINQVLPSALLVCVHVCAELSISRANEVLLQAMTANSVLACQLNPTGYAVPVVGLIYLVGNTYNLLNLSQPNLYRSIIIKL